MKNFLKKFITTFSLLSVVVWSSGVPALANESTDPEPSSEEQTVQKVNICHKNQSDQSEADRGEQNHNPWHAIRVALNGWDGHSTHAADYLYAGPTRDNGWPDDRDGVADNWCRDNAPVETVPTVTIKANKIVCDSEAALPNMSGADDINASTAQTIVDNSQGHCHFQAGWEFQWGKNDSLLQLPGNFVGKHVTDGWADFSSVTGSDASSPAEVTVAMNEVPTGNRLWFREVLQSEYVPFSYPSETSPTTPGSDVSAEFWCNQDVLNYDNAEWIDVAPGNTYYCVGINALKPIDPEPKPYAPWCSALLGIVEAYHSASSSAYSLYNDIADLDDNQAVNLSDVSLATQMYQVGDDAVCYQQFENPGGTFHFSCDNYTNIGWCSGLLQGVKDSIGSKTGDDNYNATYDLNDDGFINLSDVPLVVQLYYQNDQAACYTHFVPPMPQCSAPTPYCGDGIVNGDEQCDGGDPVACTTEDGYAGTKSCNMPRPTLNLQSVEPIYCVFNSCITTEYCGDGIKNGNEQCDDGREGSLICSPQCTTIVNPTEPICGNGIKEGEEACDDSNRVSEMCGDNVVNNGTFCNADCSAEIILTEACDAGTSGSDTCTNQCTVITPPQPGPSSHGGGGGGSYMPINIFNIQNAIGSTSANISWETTRQSLTWILYGTTTNYGSELKNTEYNFKHGITLSGLIPGTLYHYQLRAKDAGNSSTYDIDRTFTTTLTGQIPPQVLGIKENACVPDVDGDVKGVMKFIAGALIRGCGPEVYHVLGNDLYHIPNWQYLHDNYFAQRIYNVTDEVIAQYGETMTDNTKVKGAGGKVMGVKIYPDGTILKGSDGKIYVIINGKKVHIVSLEDLKKYAGNKMYKVTDQVLNQY